jgi:predicted DNA-binding transcriptional regulator AlpA
MIKRLLRFKHLKERNYVASRNQLKTLIKKHGFPQGRKTSEKIIAWEEEAVAAWYASRPLAGPSPEFDSDANDAVADKPAVAPAGGARNTTPRNIAGYESAQQDESG